MTAVLQLIALDPNYPSVEISSTDEIPYIFGRGSVSSIKDELCSRQQRKNKK